MIGGAEVGHEHLGQRAHLDRAALEMRALLPGVAAVVIDLRDAFGPGEVGAGDALPGVESAFVLSVPRAGHPFAYVGLVIHLLHVQVAVEGPEDAATREQALVGVATFEVFVDDAPAEVVAVPLADARLVEIERGDGH